MVTNTDIIELKRRTKFENCGFDKITIAFVDGGKQIVTQYRERFMAQEENLQKKFLEIIGKTYTGKMNNNILTLEIEKEEKRAELTRIAAEGLKDDEAVTKLVKSIVDNMDYEGNFLVILVHDNYDLMKKTSDGKTLDESEEVYSYLKCVICPVSREKGGITYYENMGKMDNAVRRWMVGKPMLAFQYPSFEKREIEPSHIIYYAKDSMKLHQEVIVDVLGCKKKYSTDRIRETFAESMKRACSGDEETASKYMEELAAVLGKLCREGLSEMRVMSSNVYKHLIAAGVTKDIAGKITDEYEWAWSEDWPTVGQLYREDLDEKRSAKAKRKGFRRMLENAKEALEASGDKEIAEELGGYLESTR